MIVYANTCAHAYTHASMPVLHTWLPIMIFFGSGGKGRVGLPNIWYGRARDRYGGHGEPPRQSAVAGMKL